MTPQSTIIALADSNVRDCSRGGKRPSMTRVRRRELGDGVHADILFSWPSIQR